MQKKTTFGPRLVTLRAKESQASFAVKHGAHRNTYGKYEREDRDPAWAFLVNLAKSGVNVNWLLTGEGPMLLSEQVRVRPLHLDALQMVVELVENEIVARGGPGRLDAAKKAELISLLYEDVLEHEGELNRNRVLRLLKFAS